MSNGSWAPGFGACSDFSETMPAVRRADGKHAGKPARRSPASNRPVRLTRVFEVRWCGTLGLPFWSARCTRAAKLTPRALEEGSSGFGVITSTSLGSRQIQIGAKLLF